MKIFLFKSIIVLIVSYVLIQITFVAQINKIRTEIEVLKDKETRSIFKKKMLSEINEANKKEFYFSPEERVILSNFFNKILSELDLKK